MRKLDISTLGVAHASAIGHMRSGTCSARPSFTALPSEHNMGKTRSGIVFEPGKKCLDVSAGAGAGAEALAHGASALPHAPAGPDHTASVPSENLFAMHVFSPPIVVAGVPSGATASDVVYGEPSARRCLELVAETLLNDVHLREDDDLHSNSGVDAALFLARLMNVSSQLCTMARANALWGPLVTRCFGPDAYASIGGQIPAGTCKERIQHAIFRSVTMHLRKQPSDWCCSLVIERGSDARTASAVVEERGLLTMRKCSRDERRRIVFWRSSFELRDDLSDAFNISPRVAARITDGPLGRLEIVERGLPPQLLREPEGAHKPTTRVLEVATPTGQPGITLEQLTTSLAAFESDWKPALPGKVWLLHDLRVTEGTTRGRDAAVPSVEVVWVEQEQALALQEAITVPTQVSSGGSARAKGGGAGGRAHAPPAVGRHAGRGGDGSATPAPW